MEQRSSGWVLSPSELEKEKGWKRFTLPPVEDDKPALKQITETTPSHYRGDSQSEVESEEFNDEDLELHLEQRKMKKRREGQTSPSHQLLDPATEEAKRLIHVLSKNRKLVWPFDEPVDPVALRIPDYPLVVKRPMDLDTVLKRLRDGYYVDRIKDYVSDVRLVFTNAVLYNEPTSHIYYLAIQCSNLFEKKLDKSKTIVPPMPLGLARSPRWKLRISWRRAKGEEVVCWKMNTQPKVKRLARNCWKDIN